MISLLIAIALNTLIFIIFRLLVRFKVNTFQTIVVNYIVCSIIGIYFLNDFNSLAMLNFNLVWVQTAIILGVLFVFTFYLIGFTTQACGISVATVANKMSLIIPVAFSIYVFSEWTKLFSSIQYAGVLISLVAVILTSIKGKKKEAVKIPSAYAILLPILVFAFGGAIDTLINYSKFFIVNIEQDKLFTTILFIVAAITGIIVLIVQRSVIQQSLEIKSLFTGLLLGIPNFFSIYYLVKTLTEFENNGAFVYPVVNMGIIILSALISIVAFKEKLSTVNKVGISLALLALIFLSYKELPLLMNGVKSFQ